MLDLGPLIGANIMMGFEGLIYWGDWVVGLATKGAEVSKVTEGVGFGDDPFLVLEHFSFGLASACVGGAGGSAFPGVA